jgi:preprotein translocase subunit SecG
MLIFFSVVHVLLCVFMVFVILLQPGKDAGMGAALGGGAATSAFGGRGAVTFLGKVTAVCATAFFLTSLGLSMKDLRQSVTATHAPPPKKVKPADAAGATDKKDETKPPEQGAAETPKVDPVAKTPPPPAEADAVKADDGKAGQPIPSNKPTGTEAVPAEKQPEQKK